MRDAIDRTIVEEVIAGNGVKITPQEAEAVARSIARMQAAAATLLCSSSFDETGEYYYRLLASDATEANR